MSEIINDPAFEAEAEKFAKEQEKTKIYDRPEDDPAFVKFQEEITRATNIDTEAARQGQVGAIAQGEANSNYSNYWTRQNIRISMQRWNEFVRSYPEKAQAYGDKNEEIKRALSRHQTLEPKLTSIDVSRDLNDPATRGEEPQTSATEGSTAVEGEMPVDSVESIGEPADEERVDGGNVMIPEKYQGLPSEIVEELWVVPEYIDQTKTAVEKARKEEVLEQIRAREQKEILDDLSTYAVVETKRDDREKLSQIRNQIGIENKEQPETGTETKEDFMGLTNYKVAYESLLRELESDNVKTDKIQRILYDALTIRSSYYDQLNSLGLGLSQSERMAKFMEANQEKNADFAQKRKDMGQGIKNLGMDYTKEAWFHIETNPGVPKSKELSKKIYLTLPSGDFSFMDHILELAKRVQEVSKQSGTNIQIKFPSSYAIYEMRNDSLVIHFKNDSDEQVLQGILTEWESKNGIKEDVREAGRTKIAIDSRTTSFSDLVAENVANWVGEHHGNYENDVIAREAIKHAVESSKRPPKIASPAV